MEGDKELTGCGAVLDLFLIFLVLPLLQIGALNFLGFPLPLTFKTYLGSLSLILIMKCEFSRGK